MNWLLSGDFPRSRALSILLLLIFAGLLFAPFVFPGTRSLNVAAKVAVFILLYTLLIGPVEYYFSFFCNEVPLTRESAEAPCRVALR